MGTYRKEWECCGSVTETDCWEPEVCPFCDTSEVAAERERCAKVAEGALALVRKVDDFNNGWSSAALQIAQAIRKG